MQTIRIATRQSQLALWQADFVRAQLRYYHPHFNVKLVPITAHGDKIIDTPLSRIGGKRLFVKELEVAMLEGRADIAVHSMKDLPTEFPDGLVLTTICKRGNPFDALVSNQVQTLAELHPGAVVGTSSLRRQCQLRWLRPDLLVNNLRGNVNTRLAKLDKGDYDAIVLACAGLERLELHQRITAEISAEHLLPAGGQGAVGIECRSDDLRLQELLAPLDDKKTRDRVVAERAMNRYLQGSCQVPIGCFAVIDEHNQLWLRGLVGSVDGHSIIHAEKRGPREKAETMGADLAQQLLNQGADQLLQDLTSAVRN